jgi:hypothetical protein
MNTLTTRRETLRGLLQLGVGAAALRRDCAVDMKFKIGMLTGSVHFGA